MAINFLIFPLNLFKVNYKIQVSQTNEGFVLHKLLQAGFESHWFISIIHSG